MERGSEGDKGREGGRRVQGDMMAAVSMGEQKGYCAESTTTVNSL